MRGIATGVLPIPRQSIPCPPGRRAWRGGTSFGSCGAAAPQERNAKRKILWSGSWCRGCGSRQGRGRGTPSPRPARAWGDPLYSLGRASTLARRRPPKLAGMDAGPAGYDRGQGGVGQSW